MNQTVLRADFRHWWRDHVITTVDHVAVVEQVRDDSAWNGRYVFMTLMSAGIAVLGLLLSSPAVVIGAMLISPLMGPIIGLGFGLATFDGAEIRQTAVALLLGTVLAVLFSALVVLLSPLQNVTAEIAARTRPNLFDLLVALFSALAGAYATVRGRAGTVVGVAIATALMPPLAVVGFGLATMNWTVFAGSAFLFFTNLMTIALAAAVVARFYGFGAHLSPQHTLLQTVIVTGAFAALAVPLGFALHQIAWETRTSARIREVLADQFGDDARLTQVEVRYDGDPLRVSATVFTPEFRRGVEAQAEARLRDTLDRTVRVAFSQIRVGTGAQAEAQQIASAQSANALDGEARAISDALALVAGVDEDAVVLDRDHRRAYVTAAPLDGAGLATYQALERRAARIANGWDVRVEPPAAALGNVTVDADEPDPATIATAAWGAQRRHLEIGVAGPDDRADQVVELLRAAGTTARRVPGGGSTVRLSWLPPGDPASAR